MKVLFNSTHKPKFADFHFGTQFRKTEAIMSELLTPNGNIYSINHDESKIIRKTPKNVHIYTEHSIGDQKFLADNCEWSYTKTAQLPVEYVICHNFTKVIIYKSRLMDVIYIPSQDEYFIDTCATFAQIEPAIIRMITETNYV